MIAFEGAAIVIHPDLSPDQRRLIAREAVTGAAVSGLAPTAIIHLLGLAPPSSVWGPGGLGPATLQATFFCTMLMTLAMTVVIRRRVAAGGVSPVAAGTPWLRFMPRRLAARALLLTVIMLAIAPAGAVALVLGMGLLPMSRPVFVAFNIVFGGALGIGAAPVIALAALADPVRGAGQAAVVR